MRAAAAIAALVLVGCGAEAAEPPAPRDETAPFTPVTNAAGGDDDATRTAAERDAATARRPKGWPTAQVLRSTTLRARPGGRVVARIGRRTEFGSPRVLAVTARRGRWLRVSAAELPNNRHAWIAAAATRPGAVGLSLHVDRSRRLLTVRRGDRVLRRIAVAVGRSGTPTPLGRFAVTDRLRASRPDSPYGCCALALTGHQTKLLPGWPGGDRLAIHGTPNEETVGRAASLGCMRATARDMRALLRVVPLGAPVIVTA